MGKKIWIMNHYAGNMFFDRGGRHYSFAKYLKRYGETPVIFCCNAVHNGQGLFFQNESLWHIHMAEEISVPFVFVKGRSYVGNGFGRIMNMFDFYGNIKLAAKEYAKEYGAPDIIYASSAHPLTLLAGIQLAKDFRVKCICEIRDLWPESFVAYGFIKNSNPILIPLYFLEKAIYKLADKLIFSMEGGYDYIKNRGWERDIPKEKVYYINNGVDLEIFERNKKTYTIEDDDLQDDGIFKVVYTGSLLRGYSLEKLLDAMGVINNPNIKLLIWGKGDRLSYLKQYVMSKNIKNVEFKGYVEKIYIPFILSKCNLAVLNVSPTDILKYGGSQNKLFDYLASGIPIVSGEDNKYSIISNQRCGISKRFNSSEELAEAILEMRRNNIESNHIKRVAQQYDFAILTKKLLDIIKSSFYVSAEESR